MKAVFQRTLNSVPPFRDVMNHLNLPYLEDEETEAAATPSIESISSSQSSKSGTTVSTQELGDENKYDSDDDDDDDSWGHYPTKVGEEMTGEFERSESLTKSVLSAYQTSDDEEEETENQFGAVAPPREVGELVIQAMLSIFGPCVAGGNPSVIAPWNGNNQKQLGSSRNVITSFHIVNENSPTPAVVGTIPDPTTDGITRPAKEISDNNTHMLSTVQRYHEQNDIPYYLSVLRSLEGDLNSLIDSLNMNDPSKV